jgi:hypothetical protein
MCNFAHCHNHFFDALDRSLVSWFAESKRHKKGESDTAACCFGSRSWTIFFANENPKKLAKLTTKPEVRGWLTWAARPHWAGIGAAFGKHRDLEPTQTPGQGREKCEFDVAEMEFLAFSGSAPRCGRFFENFLITES